MLKVVISIKSNDVQAMIFSAVRMQESFNKVKCIKGELLAFLVIHWVISHEHKGRSFSDEA